MMTLPIADKFVSLKGEGMWTGIPMSFIRLAGCNLKCPWCDTDYARKEDLTLEEIVDFVRKGPERIVITGGEPLIHGEKLLQLLVEMDEQIEIPKYSHLETNGTISNAEVYDAFDWVAMSPKENRFDPDTFLYADEVKLPWLYAHNEIYGEASVRRIREYFDGPIYLLPIADGPKFNESTVSSAIGFALQNPELNVGVCHQLHKCYGIK